MSHESRDAAQLSPTIGLRAEAARRLGCELENLDPDTGYLYEVRKGSHARILLGAFSPLNDSVAARIALDKFHTVTILRRAGLRTPASARCLKPGRFAKEEFPGHLGLEPARRFAAERGLPLIVKPNHGARGRGVVQVEGVEQLLQAIEEVWENDYLALLQEVAHGIDLRLDFLDDTFLFGYLRRPVTLRGDGASTVRELLRRADPRFDGEPFWHHLESDPIWRRAASAGWTLASVPAAGEQLRFDSEILNLNRLCVAEPVRELEPAWLEHGLRIGRALGLRHFGVDFKVTARDAPPEASTVLEVNASPSLVQMSRMGYREEVLEAETRIMQAILEL